MLAARNTAESVAVHGQRRPECQPFSALTAANAAAITNPNERSEPVTILSSRKKFSCVACPAFKSSLRPIMPASDLSMAELLCFAGVFGKSKLFFRNTRGVSPHVGRRPRQPVLAKEIAQAFHASAGFRQYRHGRLLPCVAATV